MNKFVDVGDSIISKATGATYRVIGAYHYNTSLEGKPSRLILRSTMDEDSDDITIECDEEGFASQFELFNDLQFEDYKGPLEIALDTVIKAQGMSTYWCIKLGFELVDALCDSETEKAMNFYKFVNKVFETEADEYA